MASTPSPELEAWVRDQYRQRYCDKKGQQVESSRIMRKELTKLRPNEAKGIGVITKKIHEELHTTTPQQFAKLLKWVEDECRQLPSNEMGGFKDKAAAIKELIKKRPDCHPSRIEQMVVKVHKQRIKAFRVSRKQAMINSPIQTSKASAGIGTAAISELEAWISDQSPKLWFNDQGNFIGYKKLKKKLKKLKPDQEKEINLIIEQFSQHNNGNAFPGAALIFPETKAESVKDAAVRSDKRVKANETTNSKLEPASERSKPGAILEPSPLSASAAEVRC